MTISILGIDIDKNSCSVVGVDDKGAVIVRRTMPNQTLIEFIGKMPACVIAVEECCGIHHLGRLLAAQGHDVGLMSRDYVRPNGPAMASFSTMSASTKANGQNSWSRIEAHGCCSSHLIGQT